MNCIIRVNMLTQKITEEPVPEAYRLLGARGLNARILLDEVDADCEPLGSRNKLIISPGLMAGTSASSSSRLSYGGKSPLTGTIKEANAGGNNAAYLARLGIKSVIIEDIPNTKDLFILYLGANRKELILANELKGKRVYETGEILKQRFENVGIACIGPAGEQLMATAGIANTNSEDEPERFAARGGLGAVMGSKGLKAIVIEKTKDKVRIQDEKAFMEGRKKYTNGLLKNETTGQGLPQWSTLVLVDPINAAGDMTVKNMSQGEWDECDHVNAQTMVDLINERGSGKMGHPCQRGCIIRCSNKYPGKNGENVCKIDYETVALLGPNLLINNLDAIAEINRKCNDVGVDTMEIAGALGVAMEAGVLNWGDSDRVLEIIDEIATGTVLGKLIGAGALSTGRVLGIKRIPVVKGQTWGGYDPRASKGQGVTYVTTPQGADHNAGYVVSAEVLKLGLDLDPLTTDGKVDVSLAYQNYAGTFDCLGICVMATYATFPDPSCLEGVVKMVNAVYGSDFTAETIFQLGDNMIASEREFNRRAGIVINRPPEFIVNEPLPPHNVVWDVPFKDLDRIV
ncbi:putative oxidoreductase YdhV [Pelotomaculum schinkii]|uniref:Putative oxidoreductase YdhV n=1 Tax=Pelotomaculum schinkii TaxID=78350 RepID=A0A4Y7RIK0_9FIRM|nr:aldehyde ferredoxin oxidoreductase C-terminal domain-containing protein [Pelotomaculum schinkii]TEB08532.1 putative oxidoreductase YdhV [Pelotomaculum schinkii]